VTVRAGPPPALVASGVPLPYHHLFDGIVPEQPTRPTISATIRAIAKAVAMKRICRTKTHRDGEAWKGMVMIAESHISVHGRGRFAWLDVFSCQPFEKHDVVRVLERRLGGDWYAQDLRRWRGHEIARRKGLL
jgi:S-adenosylmethionine/arginine decarboxylase-like enzyme